MPLDEEQRATLRHDPDLGRRVNIVRSTVPAITHVDYSARVQTVDERHGRFYRLMKAFHAKTGCPIIVNTSFNLSWEPIVLTPSRPITRSCSRRWTCWCSRTACSARTSSRWG